MGASELDSEPGLRRGRQALLRRFHDTVQADPCAWAVIGETDRLTYGALDSAAGALSRRLEALGVGPGVVVAVMLDRTAQIATAYLGVLKAGGAFLPLSPDAPCERNLAILKEARTNIVLTSESVLSGLADAPSYRDAAHLMILGASAHAGRPPAVGRGAAPKEAAYVIHTSGSTGQPKGALNSAEALLLLADSLGTLLAPLGPPPLNIALVAPFVFDPSIQQIFGALLFGHCLHLVPDPARFDGGALLAFLNGAGIDVADGTPTHLKLLVNAPVSSGEEFSPSLLLIGGEMLSPQTLTSFLARFDRPRPVVLVNLYGVAECAVDSTLYRVDPGEVAKLGYVPIGRPLPHVEVFITDDSGKATAPGMEGEIVIGGATVGLGYLGRQDLTSQKFGTTAEGLRIYRTGDLGRIGNDGLIQCLGRLDRQIKVQGVRIEPAEIEQALLAFRRVDAGSANELSLGMVQQAVALVRDGPAQQPVLCAYFVSNGHVDLVELRDHLHRRLPDFMLPKHLIQVDEIPLNTSGKVDTHRLLPPSSRSRDAILLGNETALETELRRLWSTTLGLSSIELDDNFFDLGGDSLLATKLVSSIEANLGKALSVHQAFCNPTIREMAVFLTT